MTTASSPTPDECGQCGHKEQRHYPLDGCSAMLPDSPVPDVTGAHQCGCPTFVTPVVPTVPTEDEGLARYDLRLRSLDHEPFQEVSVCCSPNCGRIAEWSVWLHTPEWGPDGGATYVRCHGHALSLLDRTRHEKHRESKP